MLLNRFAGCHHILSSLFGLLTSKKTFGILFGFLSPAKDQEDGWLKNARMVLIIMRIVCAVLLVVAAPFLGTSKTRNPNTLPALKWRAEFDVGEFGATQMYFNALSVWLQPGVGPYSIVSSALPGQSFCFFCCDLLELF